MKRLLGAFLFCVAFFVTEAAFGAYRFYGQSGAWNISYDDENHTCFASTLYPDRSQFLVGRTEPGAIYIIAQNPRWGFIKDQQYELTVEFANPNESSVNKGSVFFTALDPITIVATNFIPAFLEELAPAATVTFYYNGSSSGTFNLVGANIAIEKIEECRSHLGKPQVQIKTGSGIYISAANKHQMPGTILTNEHVVSGCSEIGVGYPGEQYVSADAFAHDEADDLALLRTMLPGKGRAAFSINVKLGQDVAVFGFPLAGELSSGGNFTTGTISALDRADDPRYLQVSNAVQPGNSGGPLLDRKGNVIGIVVARLDPSRAENVNFAIKAATALIFLEANSIPYASTRRLLPKFWPMVANTAKTFTVQIICSEQTSAPRVAPPQAVFPPPQPEKPPAQKVLRLRVVENLNLRIDHDPHSEKVLGPPPNDFISTDAVVELHYTDLNTDCRRHDATGAVHTIWCPVIYDSHTGWVNAFYLDTGNGRLSCSIDRTSFSCAQATPPPKQSPTLPQQQSAPQAANELNLFCTNKSDLTQNPEGDGVIVRAVNRGAGWSLHVIHKINGQLFDRTVQYRISAFHQDQSGPPSYFWKGVLGKDANVLMTGHLWQNAGVWMYDEHIAYRDGQPGNLATPPTMCQLIGP